MTAALTRVIPAVSSAPNHHLEALWQKPFDEALAHLRAKVEAAGLMELGIVDTTAVLRRAGLQIPEVRQVLVFHPRYMRTILEIDPAAAVEAPLKITVVQRGDTTEVRYADPAVSFAPYPRLARMATHLRETAVTLLHP